MKEEARGFEAPEYYAFPKSSASLISALAPSPRQETQTWDAWEIPWAGGREGGGGEDGWRE